MTPAVVEQAERGAGQPTGPALRARGVRVAFGGVVALDDVSFEVGRGGIHALIGPNGAGKSTLVNVVAGMLRPDAGSVEVLGKAVSPAPRPSRARVSGSAGRSSIRPSSAR